MSRNKRLRRVAPSEPLTPVALTLPTPEQKVAIQEALTAFRPNPVALPEGVVKVPLAERHWCTRGGWEKLAQGMAEKGYHLVAVVSEEGEQRARGYASFWEPV